MIFIKNALSIDDFSIIIIKLIARCESDQDEKYGWNLLETKRQANGKSVEKGKTKLNRHTIRLTNRVHYNANIEKENKIKVNEEKKKKNVSKKNEWKKAFQTIITRPSRPSILSLLQTSFLFFLLKFCWRCFVLACRRLGSFENEPKKKNKREKKTYFFCAGMWMCQ